MNGTVNEAKKELISNLQNDTTVVYDFKGIPISSGIQEPMVVPLNTVYTGS